jgi:hypothetical protein
MSFEERKLHLIELLLKVNDNKVLIAIEAVLNTHKRSPERPVSIYDFSEVLNLEEAAEMKKAIAEVCDNLPTQSW